MFELHPQLQNDTFSIGDFHLCKLLLMNDCNYPWFILVPKRQDIKELFELSEDDQLQFMKESGFLSKTICRIYQADKINIATLGNIVPQLHVHHIVRYDTDMAWPNPVWGKYPSRPYTKRGLHETCNNLVEELHNFTPDEHCPLAPRVC